MKVENDTSNVNIGLRSQPDDREELVMMMMQQADKKHEE